MEKKDVILMDKLRETLKDSLATLFEHDDDIVIFGNDIFYKVNIGKKDSYIICHANWFDDECVHFKELTYAKIDGVLTITNVVEATRMWGDLNLDALRILVPEVASYVLPF